MVLKSWGLRFVSLIGILLLTLGLRAADFGRFGFGSNPKIPGWSFTYEGMKPVFPASDRLAFDSPLTSAQPREIRAHEATFALIGGGMSPTRLRINLFAAGPELLFERGFRLRCRSLAAPLLSWAEGSVADGVETPKGRWIAISFQDSQPPILLTFLDEPASLIVQGRSGDWTISTVDPYRKWVRLALPVGVKAWSTTDAAALGEMVRQIRSNGMFWTGPSPVLQRIDAVNGPGYVDGIWTFSGPNASVPFAAFLAKRGGYAIQIQSEIKEIDAPSDEGPVAYVPARTLRIRFPMLMVPEGRSIIAGAAPIPATVPPEAHYGLFDRAMQNLMAPRPLPLVDALRATFENYLTEAPVVKIPNTQSRLSFDPKGEGAIEAGFQALVEQCLSSDEQRRPGGLLTSVMWARDSLTWQFPMIEDVAVRRRAEALASVAAALSSDARTRLEGAILHAGMCAERGHAAWWGTAPTAPLLEPLDDFRHRLYRGTEVPKREPLLPILVNPVRQLSGPPLLANNVTRGYHLRFDAPEAGVYSMTIASPQDLQFFSSKSVQLTTSHAASHYSVIAKVAARGQVVFGVQVVGQKPIPLPPFALVGYSERSR